MTTLKHFRLTTGYKVGYNNENSQKKKKKVNLNF